MAVSQVILGARVIDARVNKLFLHIISFHIFICHNFFGKKKQKKNTTKLICTMFFLLEELVIQIPVDEPYQV